MVLVVVDLMPQGIDGSMRPCKFSIRERPAIGRIELRSFICPLPGRVREADSYTQFFLREQVGFHTERNDIAPLIAHGGNVNGFVFEYKVAPDLTGPQIELLFYMGYIFQGGR